MMAGVLMSTLAACAGGGHGPGTSHAGRNVGVLLPLTGNNARLGQEMLSAARMAMNTPGAPMLDIHDTAAPGGATAAAQAAVKAKDGIILGPLTAGDATQAATVTAQTDLPMLAFTSDVSVARPDVWILGIAPEQQVRRMVGAAIKENRQHFAAFLPDNALGHAMGSALQQSCSEHGLSSPQIVYHGATATEITEQLKTFSAYESRAATAATQAAATAAQEPAPAGVDPANPDSPAAAETAASPAPATPAPEEAHLPPPPFDALLLADTGLQLGHVIAAMRTAQISPTETRIMGPGLWGAFAGKLAQLQNAWYAAPDPASRQHFVQLFMAQYHHMPTPLADLSYDAAALVKALDQAPRAPGAKNGYSVTALTRPEGFSGVDGVFGFTGNGRTRRDLAIFQILPEGGSRIVQAPSGRLQNGTN
ncbi:penicillin-binding protein activator [Novacetimonas pomaceti]|uniref:Penicillin-binding protein activator n=2 Tax=Novacetimonas pomaceti TaxID=2021998 RepID=A0ABX5P4A9_9PROT|nr:penicillin-binding protein activator [Novacetimonas pomaceti]PYD47854.1 penicillin-binding protein activator [Novacetimonas pomaceti]